MFPDARFLGLDLYYWMFLVGVLAAMVTARLFFSRVGLSGKVFNLMIVSALFGVVLGYLSAALLESFWEFLETGTFVWGTGATFYGGLIGAVLVYLAVYFLLGKFYCKEREHIIQLNKMLSLVFPCIVVAHAFGRLGCLFEGCCYGAKTDAWYGIEMFVEGEWQKRIPLQLYEALFLFALAAVLLILLLRFKFEYNVSLYLIAYGVWRFFIEFARNDDRGASGIGSLSPSQFLSIVLVIVAVAYLLFYRFYLKQRLERGETHESA